MLFIEYIKAMYNKHYIIVRDKVQLMDLFRHITESTMIAYDIETNSLNPRTGKIIGFSVSGNIGIGYYFPTKIWDIEKEELVDLYIDDKKCDDLAVKLISMLKGKNLVMHNGSFDIRFTKCYYDIDLREDLYCDTMLLRHTLKEDGPFGLKDIAIELQHELELDAEKEANEEQILMKENIKKNGGSTSKDNYELFKADMDLLGRYAAADTDLTLRVMTHYLPILKEQELWDFFFVDEVMPLYKDVTISMEEGGTLLDMELLNQLKKDITEDMTKLEEEIIQNLTDKVEVQDWVVNRAIKKFPPSRRGTYAQKLLEMSEQTHLPKNDNGKYLVSAKAVEMITDPKIKEFFETGIDFYLDQSKAIAVSLQLLKEDEGALINISSKQQMGQICFEHLGIKPISQTRKGNDQFNDDLIEVLAKDHPWAAKLRDHNKLTKIKSSYIDRFIDGSEDGRYYWYFKQHGTTSGRFSSDCQQLPRILEPGEVSDLVLKYNNIVRSFLIAEPNRKFIICDQSSLEPRVFASVSGDPNLINVFIENEDLYSRVAIQAFKLRGMSAKKSDENYVKNVRPELRQRAKSIALAIPYGAGAWQIGQTLNIPIPQAQSLIDGYLEGFPELARWMSDTNLRAQSIGQIKSKTGRIRHLDRVAQIYGHFEDNLMDPRTFGQMKKMMKSPDQLQKLIQLRMEYKNGLNNAKNFQIQSLAASIMNRSAIRIHKEFKKHNLDARIMLQIHDEFVINTSEKHAEHAAKIVKKCMETTVQIETGLVAEPNITDNFGEGHV